MKLKIKNKKIFCITKYTLNIFKFFFIKIKTILDNYPNQSFLICKFNGIYKKSYIVSHYWILKNIIGCLSLIFEIGAHGERGWLVFKLIRFGRLSLVTFDWGKVIT